MKSLFYTNVLPFHWPFFFDTFAQALLLVVLMPCCGTFIFLGKQCFDTILPSLANQESVLTQGYCILQIAKAYFTIILRYYLAFLIGGPPFGRNPLVF